MGGAAKVAGETPLPRLALSPPGLRASTETARPSNMSDQVFQVVERYILGSPIAAGGMATVYLGRPVNLPRVVAIKQLRSEMARDQGFVRMFLDEAQLLCRIRHKNVTPPIDCFQHAGEFFIVMEYVHGQSLSQLLAGGVSPGLASKIMSDVLTGLDAAHDAVDCAGQPLGLVHRDVSPHNILVGTDGAARIVDFGIAKAAWRSHVTQHGQLKGKPGYMAPEQLALGNVDRRTDVYAAGIVLWELLAGRRLLGDQSLHQAPPVSSALKIIAPSLIVPGLPRALDDVVLSALSCDPNDRFADARSMAEALLDAAPPVRDLEVGAWVTARAQGELRRREELVIELENVRMSEVTELGGRDPSRSVAAPVPGAVSDAPPSGYAVGPNEPSATPNTALDGRRHRRVRKGYLLGAGLFVTLATLGGSYMASSRRPVSGTFAAEGSPPPPIDVPPWIDAEAAAPAPSVPPAWNSERPAAQPANRSPPLSLEAKGLPRRQDALSAAPSSTASRFGQPAGAGSGATSFPAAATGSAVPNFPGNDALPRAYDPLRDDRRR
jgi:eukaryotic-like serine/threonine-protein kinase